MSKYTINYTKLTEGYDKILNCLETAESPNHLSVIDRMTGLWMNQAERYCDEVYHDRSDWHRKRNTKRLATLCEQMFEDIKNVFGSLAQDFQPRDPENDAPIKIKTLQEICHKEYDN